MTHRAFWIMVIAGTALIPADPVGATSCNTQLINQRTIEDTATDILSHSAFVGFARIGAGDSEAVAQQRLEMVFPLKGESGTLLMKPRTEHNSSQFDRVRGRPGELVFVALSGTADNAWIPACMPLGIRRFREADLFRAIRSVSLQGGEGHASPVR